MLGRAYSWQAIQEYLDSQLEEEWRFPLETKDGYHYQITSFLVWYLSQKPPTSPEAVPIKISIDNANVTRARTIKAEAVVLEDMRFPSKRHSHGFHCAIFLGMEKRKVLRENLAAFTEELQCLHQDGFVVIAGFQVLIQLFLVADLQALCLLLGLYQVYKSTSQHKCPWCEVTIKEIGDFTKQSWPFRDFFSAKYVKAARAVEGHRDRKAFARTHHGIKVSFLTSQIIDFILQKLTHFINSMHPS